MKIKRVFCIALALVLVMAVFAGCKKQENLKPTPDPENNRVIDTNKPTQTPVPNNNRHEGSTDSAIKKITPTPGMEATDEPTEDVSQNPDASETPEATDEVTNTQGSGN